MQPISPYGASKVAGEALVSSFRTKIKNCVCLRFFNVYGEGQNSEYSGVIARFIDRALKKLPPIIYGNGFQTRDFISVADVVNAIILTMGDRQEPESISPGSVPSDQQVFNIGTGTPLRIIDLAQMIAEIVDADSPAHPVYDDPVPGDIVHSYADTKRAKDILKFRTTRDVRAALVDLIESYYSKDNDPFYFANNKLEI